MWLWILTTLVKTFPTRDENMKQAVMKSTQKREWEIISNQSNFILVLIRVLSLGRYFKQTVCSHARVMKLPHIENGMGWHSKRGNK